MEPRRLAIMLALGLYCSTAMASDPATAIHERRDAGDFTRALQLSQAWLSREPDNIDAWKLQVLSLADIGAAERAWQLMSQHPERFSVDERERIEGDRIASRIRWGGAFAADETHRDDEARNALALLRRAQQQAPRQTTWEATRLRVDALSALNQLQHHQDVVDGYRSLREEGIDIPAYILPTVADSYMALRQPEQAAPILQQALQHSPGAPNTTILLAYAWIEQERFDLALPLLEQLASAQPAWPRREGALRGYENWDRYSADMTLAMARSFAQDNAAAEKALRALLAIGPADPGLQSAVAAVDARRMRPSAALERYAMALTLDPRQRDARLGQVDALLALQRPDQAAAVIADLKSRYPEDLRVPRAERSLDLQRGWQGSLELAHGRSRGNSDGTSTSPLGNRDGSAQLVVQSPLLDDRWRIAALARDGWADLPGERVRERAFGLGLRYRYDRLGVAVDALHSTDDFDRGTSLALQADWRFNDAWSGSAELRRKDPDASLQARQLGITADSLAVGLRYTPAETTEVATRVSRLHYEDGNHRDQLGVDLRQRLSSQPHLLIDALGAVYASRGSDGERAAYFNPSRDASASVGVRLDHIGWRRYERQFRQLLDITVGPYWQQGHGTAWVPSVAYRHRWTPMQGRQLEYGVSWSQPVYDGRRERRIALDLAWRWGGEQ